MIIQDIHGEEFRLTKVRLTQYYEGNAWRWVDLAELKKLLTKNFVNTATNTDMDTWPKLLHHSRHMEGGPTWVKIDELNWLSIGCKRFGPMASAAIYKAAGIKRKVSLAVAA